MRKKILQILLFLVFICIALQEIHAQTSGVEPPKESMQQFILWLLEKFILPIAVAVITFYFFKKHDEYIKRRQYSTLGVAVMESLLEEITMGIKIMEGRQTNPLPVKSWNGVSTIPDDVLLRIIAVSKGETPVSFKPQDIRIHCKNYFSFMAENWLSAIQGGNIRDLIDKGQYIQSAEKVKSMIIQCRDLLEKNSRKKFPS